MFWHSSEFVDMWTDNYVMLWLETILKWLCTLDGLHNIFCISRRFTRHCQNSEKRKTSCLLHKDGNRKCNHASWRTPCDHPTHSPQRVSVSDWSPVTWIGPSRSGPAEPPHPQVFVHDSWTCSLTCKPQVWLADCPNHIIAVCPKIKRLNMNRFYIIYRSNDSKSDICTCLCFQKVIKTNVSWTCTRSTCTHFHLLTSCFALLVCWFSALLWIVE